MDIHGAYGIIYLGSFISLIPEWNSINKILNKYFMRFYQLIILSISYIINIKYLNYHFKIERNYLTYSSWVISIVFHFHYCLLLLLYGFINKFS